MFFWRFLFVCAAFYATGGLQKII